MSCDAPDEVGRGDESEARLSKTEVETLNRMAGGRTVRTSKGAYGMAHFPARGKSADGRRCGPVASGPLLRAALPQAHAQGPFRQHLRPPVTPKRYPLVSQRHRRDGLVPCRAVLRCSSYRACPLLPPAEIIDRARVRQYTI